MVQGLESRLWGGVKGLGYRVGFRLWALGWGSGSNVGQAAAVSSPTSCPERPR